MKFYGKTQGDIYLRVVTELSNPINFELGKDVFQANIMKNKKFLDSEIFGPKSRFKREFFLFFH